MLEKKRKCSFPVYLYSKFIKYISLSALKPQAIPRMIQLSLLLEICLFFFVDETEKFNNKGTEI